MKFDIISDTHFDSWFGRNVNIDKEEFLGFWRRLRPNKDSEALIIGGDIGENLAQNVMCLWHLKKIYKHVLVVLGNHDLYSENGWHWALEEAKRKYAEIDVIVLDGTIVELNGIKICGCMSWYDGSYLKHFENDHYLQDAQAIDPGNERIDPVALWRVSMVDFGRIGYLNDFREIWKVEKKKLDRICFEDVDIIVTHVNPSIAMEHQHPSYEDDEGTCFFNFDGLEYLEKCRAQYWIYGHSHYLMEWSPAYNPNLTVICNSLGYSRDNREKLTPLRLIEVKGATE